MPPATAEGLGRFSATAAAHVADETVPGLVALVARGDQVHVEALGSLSIGGPPVRRDSLFRIASTTKPVTGAATLALVREGLLALDEPVDVLLPELADPRVLRRMDGPLDDTVPAERPVTVRDLLTFTFGFGVAAEMFSAEQPWRSAVQRAAPGTLSPPDPAEQPGPDLWIAGLGSLPRWPSPVSAGTTTGPVRGAPRARGGPAVRGRAPDPPLRAAGHARTAFWTPHTGRLASAFRSAPGGGLEVWDKPEGMERAAGVLRRGLGPGLHRRRPARVHPDAAARGTCTACGRGRRDDPGPAHPGPEGPRWPRSGLLRRDQLGLLHLGGHRRGPGWRVRLGGRLRHHLAGGSGPGPSPSSC